jgi:hypothetical protein
VSQTSDQSKLLIERDRHRKVIARLLNLKQTHRVGHDASAVAVSLARLMSLRATLAHTVPVPTSHIHAPEILKSPAHLRKEPRAVLEGFYEFN